MSIMPEETKPRRWFRNYLVISSIFILALLVYTVSIFVARYRERQEAAAERAKVREEAARTYENLGGSEFKITNFYGVPAALGPRESATICYGVSNAKSVRLDPPVEEVWPSFNRCFDVSPKKTTTYTLTIEDGSGHTKSSSIAIEVHR
jgi:hypothetical protein